MPVSSCLPPSLHTSILLFLFLKLSRTETHVQFSDKEAESQPQWPPEDPAVAHLAEADDTPINLPDTPWTYSDGSLNPELTASSSNKLRQRTPQKSRVPPYHPDYVTPSDESSDDAYYAEPPSQAVRLRRGSEGYEIRPVDREEMLRQYIQDQTAEIGRYNVYEPEPPSEESESEDDEHIPLARKVEDWRTEVPVALDA